MESDFEMATLTREQLVLNLRQEKRREKYNEKQLIKKI